MFIGANIPFEYEADAISGDESGVEWDPVLENVYGGAATLAGPGRYHIVVKSAVDGCGVIEQVTPITMLGAVKLEVEVNGVRAGSHEDADMCSNELDVSVFGNCPDEVIRTNGEIAELGSGNVVVIPCVDYFPAIPEGHDLLCAGGPAMPD
jgi:hypothetical protein